MHGSQVSGGYPCASPPCETSADRSRLYQAQERALTEQVARKQAIANNIASFIRPGAPGIEAIDFRVINIAANGPVVMTERVDVFTTPGKSFELPVMGVFEVSDGKINAWRDYFDMNQFTSRME